MIGKLERPSPSHRDHKVAIPKGRCTSCDWVVDVDGEGIAEAHGWRDFGQCPGTGTPSEDPNCKTF